MQARHPDREGRLDCDGVGIGYRVYGEQGPTVLLMPTWTIIHDRLGRRRSRTCRGTSGW